MSNNLSKTLAYKQYVVDEIAKIGSGVTSVNGMTGDVVIEIPEINYPVTSVNGMTGDVVIDIPSSLPTVTAENNGAFLRVVDGAWAVATIPSAEGVSF